MEEKKLVVLLDSVNRTILAERVQQTATTITVINPAIISIMPKPNGQMSAQLIPVFFREILDNKNQKCEFTYPLTAVTVTNIVSLDKQFQTQYFNLFKDVPTNVIEPQQVDLFTEGK